MAGSDRAHPVPRRRRRVDSKKQRHLGHAISPRAGQQHSPCPFLFPYLSSAQSLMLKASKASVSLRRTACFSPIACWFASFLFLLTTLTGDGLVSRKRIPFRGLDLVQFCVHPVTCHQSLVSALFHQFTILDHKNNVGVADSAQMMRNDDRSPALHQFVQSVNNQLL